MPILQDLYETLNAQPEPEAKRLAVALEIYCAGSLNVFNHRTNVVCYRGCKAMDGMGMHQIAHVLSDEKIERPSYYHGKNGVGTRQSDYDPNLPYAWRGSTVANILRTLAYCGHLVNLRMATVDFKTGKTAEKPKDEWVIFENRHEAIISQEVFDTVQKLRQTPCRIDKLGYANPLTGLLWCADYGAKLYNYRRSEPRKPTETKLIDVYQCSTYKIGKKDFQDTCTVHHISTEMAHDIILDILKRTSGYIQAHEDKFVEMFRNTSAEKQDETARSYKKLITKNEKRISDLNRIFQSLYEDKALGKLAAERFDEMIAAYEKELGELKAKNTELQAEIDEFTADNDKVDKFLALVRRYTRFEELTPAMINEFVDKIIVYEGEWSEGFNKENGRPMGTRSQRVDVYLKYIGNFNVPDIRTEEEIEAERKAAEKLEKKRKHGREYMRKRMAEKRATEASDLPIAANQ